MKRVVSIAFWVFMNGLACAQRISTPADAFNAGKDFADIGKNAASAKINPATGGQELPHYGTTAPEMANFQGGKNLIGVVGINKQVACENNRASTAFLQQECDAVNFLSKTPTTRPKYTLDKSTDPLLIGSKVVINNPGRIPGASAQQCRVERVKNPATYITETCTETQTLENLSCKRILRVACDPARDGCDQGGIVPNSWTGDMSTHFTPDGSGNYILQFGTIANDYWRGWGTIYDRTLTFDIRDVELITKFSLTRAAFDDWLMVKVNESIVYVGPHGGDRLDIYSSPPVFESSSTRSCKYRRYSNWQCADANRWGNRNAVNYQFCTSIVGGWNCRSRDYRTGMVQYCETCFSRPELSTSWNFTLNIDVKPYLKNGPNSIFMRTIVAGEGEGRHPIYDTPTVSSQLP